MKKKGVYLLSIVFIFFVAFIQNAYAKAPKDPLHIYLSKSLGFVMGQRYSLNRIKAEYPVLSMQIKMAEIKFNSAFGIANKKIKKELENILKDRYPAFLVSMREQISNTLKSQPITQDIAQQFIEEVNFRAEGIIPSPMLETLLSYQYREKPVNEFLREYKSIYRTRGHSKAKGLDFQIEYPRSWSKQEGKRPNVIQLFKNNYGHGFVYTMIMTKDLVKEAQGNEKLTPQEIKELKTLKGSRELATVTFSDTNLKEMAHDMGMVNIRNINTKRIIVDRWPGAILEFTGDMQRLDLTITSHVKLYLTLYKNHLIFLQFQIGKLPSETEAELEEKESLYDPLFRLIANSLVIQSQY